MWESILKYGLLLAAGWSLGLLGLYFFHPSRRHHGLRRALSLATLRHVQDAKDGELLKVLGRITVSESTISAPLSGSECVACEITQWSYDFDGQTAHATTDVLISKILDFGLVDESGSALVDSQRTELDLEHTRKHYKPNDTRVVNFLKRENRPLPAADAEVEYCESILAPGAQVAVVGVARWEVDTVSANWSSYRESARRLRIVAPKGGAVLISNDPNVIGNANVGKC